MSSTYDTSIMIGNTYNNVAEHLQPSRKLYDDEITEYMESLGLKFAPPWLNAEPQYWFVGFYIPDTPLTESDWKQWSEKIQIAYNKLREIVGPDLKLELNAVRAVW